MQIVIDTNAEMTGPLSNLEIGYNVFRVFTGVNLFFHGFTRVWAGIGPWAATEAQTFADSMFPVALAHLFLQILPYFQVALGALIALGLFTRVALLGGLTMFFCLLIGHLVRQNWAGAHIVMHYGMYYWILFALLTLNRVSIDARRSVVA